MIDLDHTLNNSWTRGSSGVEIVKTLQGERLLVSTPTNQSLPVGLSGGLGRTTYIVQKVNATNGAVYLIDDVIIPPVSLTTTGKALGWEGFRNTVSGGQLYDVVDTLVDKTFFVPTDDAINGLLSQVAKAGFTLQVSTLSVIIDNHINAGTKLEGELIALAANGDSLTSALPNEKLSLALQDGILKIKGATTADIPAGKIIQANILVTGGIVHVIDSVLVPSNKLLIASLTQKVPTIPH